MTSCNRFLNELCYSRKKSMRRLGKLRFAILLLFCTSPIFGQTRDNSLESIRSAIRAQDFDKAIELSQAPEPSGFLNPTSRPRRRLGFWRGLRIIPGLAKL